MDQRDPRAFIDHLPATVAGFTRPAADLALAQADDTMDLADKQTIALGPAGDRVGHRDHQDIDDALGAARAVSRPFVRGLGQSHQAAPSPATSRGAPRSSSASA